MGSKSIQLLAYQYRILDDDPCYRSVDQRKFADFLIKLKLRDDVAVRDESKKTFSYPDLYRQSPSDDAKKWLMEQFNNKLSGVTLNDIYVVHAKQDAQHIGFTASVVFEMEMKDPGNESIHSIFVPYQSSKPSRFHQEFKSAWKVVADTKETLPVVLFRNDISESLWHRPTSDRLFDSPVSVFGSPALVTLPSGRSVRVQRGFPYVSYVIHGPIESVLPEEIHHCDFAMLMALPGFVEQKMESVRDYRKKLVNVQQKLEDNDFAAAGKAYSEAWKDFEKVQGLAPTTTAAVQRILQKYPGDSVFALIAKDNSELVEFTVTAAIAATDQVRSNIQSVAQQGLQSSYNELQQNLVDLTASTRDLQEKSVNLTASIQRAGDWTKWATIVLALVSVISVVMVIIAHYSPARTQVIGMPQDPIRVIAEPPPPATPVRPVALKILSKLDRSLDTPTKTVVLTSEKNITELIGKVPTPMAITDVYPIELAIVQADGTVIARNSLTTEKAAVAIQFAANKDLFVKGQQYYVQVSQSSVWMVKLPIKIVAN